MSFRAATEQQLPKELQLSQDLSQIPTRWELLEGSAQPGSLVFQGQPRAWHRAATQQTLHRTGNLPHSNGPGVQGFWEQWLLSLLARHITLGALWEYRFLGTNREILTLESEGEGDQESVFV